MRPKQNNIDLFLQFSKNMKAITIAILCAIFPSKLYAFLDPNVCTRRETYIEKINVTHLEPYTVRDYTWCVAIPPRCSRTLIKHKTIQREQILYKFKPVKDCCTGYKRNSDDNNLCTAICSNCNHGTCVGPNICKCEPGYGGSSCEMSCPIRLWGDKCQYDCQCKNNSTCDVSNGNCTCLDGWKGTHCDLKCRTGRFGKQCLQRCSCENGECHHVSGECFRNESVDTTNRHLTETVEKELQCSCQNGGTCNGKNNVCLCKPGWEGNLCQNTCKEGFWGINCASSCDCFNNAYCQHISGGCICKPGFIGYRCRNICPNGRYGINCNSKCQCQNGGICSHVDGKCTCSQNWTGAKCDIDICSYVDGQQICSDIFPPDECRRICSIVYLGSVESDCKCPNENFICDQLKKCVCKEGYTGANCDITTDTSTLLIVVGVISGLVFIIALFVMCIVVIRRRTTQNSVTVWEHPLNNLSFPNNIDRRNVKEYDGLSSNYYRMHPSARTHVYEEIREEQPLAYQTLDFWRPINQRNQNYQQPLNSNIHHNDIPKNIRYKNNNFQSSV